MSTVIYWDRAGFVASSATIEGEMVCILTPDAVDDRLIQADVRRLMKGRGIDCATCQGCPIGQARYN